MPGQTHAEVRKKLALKSTALAANSESLAHLEGARTQIDDVLEELEDLTGQQARFTSQKQETSQRIVELLSIGGTLMAFVNVGVRQYYGNRSEKLVEFGLQPFRGRSRRTPVPPAAPKPPVVEPPAPPAID